MRGLGVSSFSVEIFWSHSAENFRGESLWCFTTFGCRKSLDKRGGGEVSIFSIEIFLSHSAEEFRRETL